MKNKITFLSFIIFSKSFAQNAESVIDKYIEKIGGAKAIHSIETYSVRSNTVSVGMSVNNYYMYSKLNKYRFETVTENGTLVCNCSDGDTLRLYVPSRSSEPMLPSVEFGPNLKDKPSKAHFFINSLTHYKDYGFNPLLLDTVEIDKKRCYNIKLTNSMNTVEIHAYISLDDFSLIKETNKSLLSYNHSESEKIYLEYGLYGGIKLPTKVLLNSPMILSKSGTITKYFDYVFNPVFDEKIFKCGEMKSK